MIKVLEFQIQHQFFQWIFRTHFLNIQEIDWLDLLAVQGNLKSLLQHHSSKASILQHSAFFIVQLSHPHLTTGKTTAWTRWTFVGKVISLLLNMLSRLVITFLPRSKHLLISWLQSPSTQLVKKLRPGAWLTQSHIVQFSAVQSLTCVRLCDAMNCSTSGFPVHHQLPASTQTHVHWESDAIQPSYPLSFPSPPALNLSQYQGFFQ